MTPQEVFEYKMKWKPIGFAVRLHSDLDWKGKDWCRKNLERHQWSMDTYTDVYEHTFFFEKEEHAKLFETQFNKKFVNQGECIGK
jgi:hypothetical protein